MSEPTSLSLPEAAARLGVSLRVLRRAMRAGQIAAPAGLSASTRLSGEWLEAAQQTADATPTLFGRTVKQKVPPFARYRGTSAWRKYRRRVHDYARFRAAQDAK